MRRILIILVPILITITAIAATACDGDGGFSSPTPDATLAPEATATAVETTPPESTPMTNTTPAPDPIYTPDPSLAGVRITPPDDLDAFLALFIDKQIEQIPCTLAGPGQWDCGEHGIYLPIPPPAANVECDVVLADGELAVLLCTVQQPLANIYYEIP